MNDVAHEQSRMRSSVRHLTVSQAMSELASTASSEQRIPDQPDRATLGSLRRLTPYLRPYRWPLLGGGLAALAGTLAGLVIPLITRSIVDGPIARGELD